MTIYCLQKRIVIHTHAGTDVEAWEKKYESEDRSILEGVLSDFVDTLPDDWKIVATEREAEE